MKAELLLDQVGRNPEWNKNEAVARALAGQPYDVPSTIPKPKGTIIDHPDAYKLVRMGSAIPADDECAKACGVDLSPEAIQERLQRYINTEKGMSTGLKKYDAEVKRLNETDTDEEETEEDDA